jgi:hypothetical protein
MNTIHSAEQQLNLALQQNEAQQRMISHISERLAAMEEAGKIGDEKVQLLTNQLNSAALAAADVAALAAAAKSNPSPTPLRYKAANPTPFSGQPDTLQPWIHQVAPTSIWLTSSNRPPSTWSPLSSSHPAPSPGYKRCPR